VRPTLALVSRGGSAPSEAIWKYEVRIVHRNLAFNT
jgi:hypothetical protein